jgi:hypothetical protein
MQVTSQGLQEIDSCSQSAKTVFAEESPKQAEDIFQAGERFQTFFVIQRGRKRTTLGQQAGKKQLLSRETLR